GHVRGGARDALHRTAGGRPGGTGRALRAGAHAGPADADRDSAAAFVPEAEHVAGARARLTGTALAGYTAPPPTFETGDCLCASRMTPCRPSPPSPVALSILKTWCWNRATGTSSPRLLRGPSSRTA